MQITYQLQQDDEQVQATQRASLTTKEFGLQPTHGLFGSKEWWANIQSGILPLHRLVGIITKVYIGSMGDWPEFSMRTDSGDESSWTRFANSTKQYELYVAGRRIELDYVVQRFKPSSWSGDSETKCVIEIRIDVP